jgi:predicted Zn-dependent protease
LIIGRPDGRHRGRFDRDQERDADREGLKLAHKAGFSMVATALDDMYHFSAKPSRLYLPRGAGGAAMTHPSTISRYKATMAMIQRVHRAGKLSPTCNCPTAP